MRGAGLNRNRPRRRPREDVQAPVKVTDPSAAAEPRIPGGEPLFGAANGWRRRLPGMTQDKVLPRRVRSVAAPH